MLRKSHTAIFLSHAVTISLLSGSITTTLTRPLRCCPLKSDMTFWLSKSQSLRFFIEVEIRQPEKQARPKMGLLWPSRTPIHSHLLSSSLTYSYSVWTLLSSLECTLNLDRLDTEDVVLSPLHISDTSSSSIDDELIWAIVELCTGVIEVLYILFSLSVDSLTSSVSPMNLSFVPSFFTFSYLELSS